MVIDRWVVKFAAAPANTWDAATLIPMFHRWIQERRLPLTLVDVADYTHVPQGPGVLLVAHEYNVFVDCFGGQPGLSVQRKLRGAADGTAALLATVAVALRAVDALHDDPAARGLAFALGNVECSANDRLRAPNSDEGWRRAEPHVRAAARALYGDGATVARVSGAGAERLRARVTGTAGSARDLLARVAA